MLAYGLNLFHARHGKWNEQYKNNFDWQCQCKFCWQDAGEQYYKIVGVKVSNNPLPLSNRDKSHQRRLHCFDEMLRHKQTMETI